jgi:hypothetical protein
MWHAASCSRLGSCAQTEAFALLPSVVPESASEVESASEMDSEKEQECCVPACETRPVTHLRCRSKHHNKSLHRLCCDHHYEAGVQWCSSCVSMNRGEFYNALQDEKVAAMLRHHTTIAEVNSEKIPAQAQLEQDWHSSLLQLTGLIVHTINDVNPDLECLTEDFGAMDEMRKRIEERLKKKNMTSSFVARYNNPAGDDPTDEELHGDFMVLQQEVCAAVRGYLASF